MIWTKPCPGSRSIPSSMTTMASRWIVLLAAIGLGPTASAQSCPTQDISFELVTGYVFTAPEFILDTQPGVLLLEECINFCHRNASCNSVNYETGLCVLFMSSAELNPDSLTESQFPVFTLYAQKTCVRAAKTICPGRAWIFDRVLDFQMRGFERDTLIVDSKAECMAQCLAQTAYICRSATYETLTQECVLSDMDRHTVSSRSAFGPSIGVDYLENNCAEEPSSVCNFRPMTGRILKTVDSVFANVASKKDCEQLCVSSSYRCHSYDFGDTGLKICRLSHHSSSTLKGIREPYLAASEATTYELASCFNVSVECQSNYMIAKVRTNRVFNGKIYGKTRPNSCTIDIENKLDFELYLGFNDIDCDVQQESPGRFGSDVIIQHHDMIVTSDDVGLKVRCNYNLANTTIVSNANLNVQGGLSQTGAENTVVASPNVTLRVTDRTGADILSAKVGDPLALRFEIVEKESPYEIFVRDLIAMDGLDSSEIVLIDSRGCPTDFSILGTVFEVNGTAQVLQSNFDAFKFPTSDLVQFRALVTPCIPRCDPVQCDITNYYGKKQSTTSYGRRKRRQVDGFDTSSDQDVMVAGVIRISDKFELAQDSGSGSEAGEDEDTHSWLPLPNDQQCLNTLTFSLGAMVFVFIQCLILGIWSFCYFSRQRRKREDSLVSSLCSRPNSVSERLEPFFPVSIWPSKRSTSDLCDLDHHSRVANNHRRGSPKLAHLDEFQSDLEHTFGRLHPRNL